MPRSRDEDFFRPFRIDRQGLKISRMRIFWDYRVGISISQEPEVMNFSEKWRLTKLVDADFCRIVQNDSTHSSFYYDTKDNDVCVRSSFIDVRYWKNVTTQVSNSGWYFSTVWTWIVQEKTKWSFLPFFHELLKFLKIKNPRAWPNCGSNFLQSLPGKFNASINQRDNKKY